jgi:PAS domain S-box-containing protein
MAEHFGANKRELLKELLRKLHRGTPQSEVEAEFRKLAKEVTPVDIAQVEEELIKEGMPREEIQRLCDVHLAVMRESLEKERAEIPAGHPVHILMEEHRLILEFAGKLKEVAGKIKDRGSISNASSEMEHLAHIVQHLKDSESHYIREENVLFPSLEKHGITQPPAIMWMEHDRIRGVKKELYQVVEAAQSAAFSDFVSRLDHSSLELAEMLSSHFFKENNILFPTALKVITEAEWRDIRHQFDDLGYCCFTPEPAKASFAPAVAEAQPVPGVEGVVSLETGSFSTEELEAVLNTLPVDITFVDKDDTVRYFSQSKDRIFARTKAVIGRKVQQCHPQKSVHVVNQILEDFKAGKRDVAEFWIDLKGRLVYIRYFAVRNKAGKYLGCLEVTQDITAVKKIEGEKRLLE